MLHSKNKTIRSTKKKKASGQVTRGRSLVGKTHPDSELLAPTQLSLCEYRERDRGLGCSLKSGKECWRWGISQPGVHGSHATHPRDRSLPERALKPNALATWHWPEGNSTSLRHHSEWKWRVYLFLLPLWDPILTPIIRKDLTSWTWQLSVTIAREIL